MANFYASYPVLGGSGGGSGVTTLAPVGAAPNANAGVIAGTTLTLEPADATHPGVVTALAQTIAGVKTFSSAPILSSLSASQALGTDGSKNVVSIPYAIQATGSTLAMRDSQGNIIFNNSVSNVDVTVSAGTTTLLSSANALEQLLTGSLNQTYTLPNATTLRNGWNFEFNNTSSGTLTTKDNGGTILHVIPTGGWVRYILTDSSTAAGVWDSHLFGPSNATWGSNEMVLTGTLSVPLIQNDSLTLATPNTNTASTDATDISINGGTALAATSNGGAVKLQAGPAHGNLGTGGAIAIAAGLGDFSTTGSGGAITIFAGTGHDAGGQVDISAGNGAGLSGGLAGNLNLFAGSGTSGSTNGGHVNIQSGDSVSGTLGRIRFLVGTTPTFQVGSDASVYMLGSTLRWFPDGGGDIGSHSGADRPQNAFLAGNLQAAGVLQDGSNVASVDLNNRNLKDSANVQSIAWSGRVMTDASNINSLGWNSRELRDTANQLSADWANRNLIDSNISATSVAWDARLLKDATGAVTVLDWNTKQTAGGVTTSGFTANTSSNFVYAESTFTGGTGATAYTVSDIVKALKTYGLFTA